MNNVKFTMRYDVFPRVMQEKINFMRRDLEAFEPFGYTEEKIEELEDKLNAFEDLPTDEELEADQMIATENKDKHASDVRDKVRKVMVRVKRRINEDSPHYRKFGTVGLASMKDEKLLQTAKRVVRAIELYMDQIGQGTGLDDGVLDDLRKASAEYEEALHRQDFAMADRDIATNERANISNDIYEQVVRICDTGRTIWRNKDDARYNDYIIYDTPSGDQNDTVVDMSQSMAME